MRGTLTCVVLCVILIAGCDSGDDEPETVQRDGSCDLYLADRGVSVRFAGERAARVCDEWLADRDGPWSRAAGPAADSSFERVCVLFREGTGAALYATGEPGSYRGAAATCSGLTGEGWTRLNPPTGQRATSKPSRFEPVLCAEGQCTQEGKDVAQPAEGEECGEGAWTYVGISSDGQAGVYRCLTDPKPGALVVCDSYNERCRQRSYAVRHPEPGAACGPEGMEWAEAETRGSSRVYRCTG